MEKNGCITKNNNVESDFKYIKTGVLTGKEIIQYGLIKVEDNNKQKSSLKPTTFDLTLGEGHCVYSGDSTSQDKWKLVHIGSEEEFDKINQFGREKYVPPGENRNGILTIPAYGSALIQLRETVDTYTVGIEQKLLVVGRFDLKLGTVYKGLISQQATQVEPFYQGKLFCFIHNLSNRKVELKYGEKVATIEFSYVSQVDDGGKYDEIVDDLTKMNEEKYGNVSYCDSNGIREVRYFRQQNKLPDDCGLLGLKDMIYEEITKDDEFVERLVESSSFMDKLVKKIGEKLKQ